MKIAYKCSCMAEEVEAEVPVRREGEDIVAWMQGVVQPALYLDHRTRSPACRAQTLEYAKIPCPENAPFIGAAPKLDS